MHLEDEEIQRLLHQELAEPAGVNRLEHLSRCAVCRGRVEQAGRDEREIFRLLEQLDHPAPRVDISALMRVNPRAPAGGWRRKAAVIALVLGGAGVAYAAPGSPLPAWFRTMAASLVKPNLPSPPKPRASTVDSTAATPSGIAVPAGTRLAIVFKAEQDAGTVTARLTDGPDVVVRAMHGSAAFLTDVERLTVANEGSVADYEVDLPRTAPLVILQVGERRLLLKHGETVISDVSPNSDGAYVLPFRR
jgi:hypothetical protein